MTDLTPCPFCGGIPQESIEQGAIASKVAMVSCPNANCPASVIHTDIGSWQCRAPNKDHKELAIELHDLKHAIREALCRIEGVKCDLSGGNSSCCEVLHNAGVQRDLDIIKQCCGEFL